MNKDQLFFLGTFGKPVGLKGEVSFRFDCDNPENYRGIKAIFIQSKTGILPFKISAIRLKHGLDAFFQLEGLNSVEAVNSIKGCEAFLPLDFLPKLSGNQFYYHEIIGFTLIDQNSGEIGKIKDVLEYPQHDLFQVIHLTGREVLIPVRDELILKVNRELQQIEMNVPEGLVNIYLSDNDEEE